SNMFSFFLIFFSSLPSIHKLGLAKRWGRFKTSGNLEDTNRVSVPADAAGKSGTIR
ncbi:hypothetical protein L9F63_006035, partial [Diploptera punctata]